MIHLVLNYGLKNYVLYKLNSYKLFQIKNPTQKISGVRNITIYPKKIFSVIQNYDLSQLLEHISRTWKNIIILIKNIKEYNFDFLTG